VESRVNPSFADGWLSLHPQSRASQESRDVPALRIWVQADPLHRRTSALKIAHLTPCVIRLSLENQPQANKKSPDYGMTNPLGSGHTRVWEASAPNAQSPGPTDCGRFHREIGTSSSLSKMQASRCWR
jgi:hypothetical protein